MSRRGAKSSRKVSNEELVTERLGTLAEIIGNIQDKNKLAMAHECLSVFEKAIEDVAAPKKQSDSTVEQPELTVEQATTTTVEAATETTVTFQTEPGQVLLESLQFTPEPEPYDPFMEFQIPERELERKQLLKSGNVNKGWSHLLYQNKEENPPKVHYCKTFEEANKTAALFLNDKFLGFDLEWDPFVKVTEKSPRYI